MKILGASAVESLLTMGECVEVVDGAMRAVTNQQVLSP